MAETETQNKPFLALYRKYRPQTFDDVRGRDNIVRTLKNQIITGRTSHSYLFCGTRGTGKTTIAKIFARAVNCEHPEGGNPDGTCPSCRAIAEGASLNVIEIDAASNNGVDDVRNIIDGVRYSPTSGKKRVYIIDEAHMLTGAAANALLKTLEEPPEYAIFILCTTEPNKLPITILSRCQRYDFGRLSTEVIEGRLEEVCGREGLAVEERALHYIAGAADGSLRDGLSLLDQCCAFNYGNDTLTYDKTLDILGAVDAAVFSDLYRCVHKGDARGALQILDKILAEGRELVQAVTDFVWYLRNLMLLKASEDTAKDLDVSKENLARMLEDARGTDSMDEIVRDIRVLSELSSRIRFSGSRRILTEAALIRLCEPEMDTDLTAVRTELSRMRQRVEKDEKKLAELEKNGIVVQGAAGTGASGDAQGAGGILQGGAGGNGSAGAAGRHEKPPLPRALPEELVTVSRNWPKILAEGKNDRMSGYLKGANLSVAEDGTLLIVLANRIAVQQFADGKSAEAEDLSRMLTEATGKEVPWEVRLVDKAEDFQENYWDLADVVNMQIDVDDTV